MRGKLSVLVVGASVLTAACSDGSPDGSATSPVTTESMTPTSVPSPTSIVADEDAEPSAPTTAAGATVPGSTPVSSVVSSLPPASTAPASSIVVTVPEVSGVSVGEQAAVDAWQSVWRAAGAGDSSAGPVAGGLVETFDVFGAQLPGEIVFSTVVTQADGGFEVEDCLISTEGFVGALWMRGVVTSEGVVNEIDTTDANNPCVPADIAAAALQGYADYWEARTQFWNPPDPNHPLIAATTTGAYSELTQNVARDFVAAGTEWRGVPQTDPFVAQLNSASSLMIEDCQAIGTEWGAFDSATGERTGDAAPVTAGRQDFRRTLMLFVDGVWKVADIAAAVDARCGDFVSQQAEVVGA